MATIAFTYNALRTKTLKERIKTQGKIVSHSNSTRANSVGLSKNAHAMRDTVDIMLKCFKKCQICSNNLNVSGLTLLQFVVLGTRYKNLCAYARTECTHMKQMR